MSDDKIRVVPLEEHNKAFKDISNDLLSLREQVKTEKETTDLELSERKDDLIKHTEDLDDIVKRLEVAEADVKLAKRNASFETGDKAFRGELQKAAAGFREPMGTDDEFRERDPGTKLSIKNLIEGVYLKSGEYWEPKHERIKELQDMSDSCLLLDALMRQGVERDAYAARGGIRSLDMYKDLRAKAEIITKADGDLMDTTDTSDWVPTHFTSQIWGLVKIALPETALFREVTMPGKSLDLNVDLTDTEAMLIAETTTLSGADPFAGTTSFQTLTDAKATLTAKKLRARVLASNELEEDAIVALLPLIRQSLVRMIGEGLADCICNGNAADDLESGGTHFGKANEPMAATDSRQMFDGLREWSSEISTTEVSMGGAAPTLAGLRSVRLTLGEYGVNPSDLAYVASTGAYIQLLSETAVQTVDKWGPSATARTGTLAMIDGSDMLVSRRMPLTENAAGIMDGVTENLTSISIVNTLGAILGNRRRITVGSTVWGPTDTVDLYAFWRGDVADLFGSSYTWIGRLYNISQ